MANYKDILNGTLRSLGDKVKEVGEAGGVKEIYARGAERAKSYARAAKLSLAINGDTEELRKIYTEIGKLYFDQNREAPGALFAGLFAQAEEIRTRMADKEAELRQLPFLDFEAREVEKNGDIEVEIGEFEDIVNATESDVQGR